MRKFLIYLVAFSTCAPLRADFTYQETAQITGGSLYEMLRSVPLLGRSVRDPIVSTHILKGNRMATVTKDRVSVMDLDRESITTIDVAKKTYSVMTFAEMKQAMEDAAKRMQNERKEAAPSDPNVQASFKVSAKATGQTKTVQGLNANEMLVEMALEGSNTKTGETGAMNITADTWYAQVPGYEEVKEFHKRMGVKLGYVFGSGMQQIMQMSAAQGGQANMNQGFEEVSKELAKIDGVPVESVVKMGGSGAPGGDVSGTQPAAQPQQQEKQTSAGSAIAGAALGRLGGFGGFGRKKKEEPPAPREQPTSQGQPGPGATGTLMEMTTSLTSFSSGPADDSKFEVPAGYKQVEPDMRRRGR